MPIDSTGEKRKQNKQDNKRTTKRSKKGGDTSAATTVDDNNLSETTERNDDVDPSNYAKPLSSSSSQTIDDTVEGGQSTTINESADDASSDNQTSDVLESIDESAVRPSDPQDVGYTVKGETINFKTPDVLPLDRVPEQGTRFKGVRDIDNLPFCKLDNYFARNRTKALRVLRYTTEAVGRNMTSVFKANPQEFARVITGNLSRSRRVVSNAVSNISDKFKLDSTFFIVGRVVHSALLGDNDDIYSREVSVQPIHRFTPRAISAIAQMLDFRRPVFPLRDDGLQFTTTRKPFDDSTKVPTIRNNPMNGVTHGPSPRTWREEVPLFDGRSHFQLSNYATLERMNRELHVGDFALVAFTLGGWRSTTVLANDHRAERVSLNVQFAILLERPVDNDQRGVSTLLTDDMKDETPIGVKDTTDMRSILPNELTDEEVAMQTHSLSASLEGPAM